MWKEGSRLMADKFIPTTQDEISRDAIVHDIDTNFFVEAGAGSGKTTMLVNRMVAMVETGIPVEKICAITFTKNAALEFYERFEAKLIERSNPNNDKKPCRAGDLDEPNPITRQRCLAALENIDLCFMGTIDSFCNMILSEHPSEANISSDSKLIDEYEALKIYRQFYIDARSGLYGKEIKVYADRFAQLYWKPEDNFAALATEIMDRRNVNFEIDESLCIDFFKCFSKVREEVKRALDIFNKDTSKITIKLSYSDNRDMMDVYENANEVLQKGWHYNYTGVQKAVRDLSNLTYDASPNSLGFTNESVVREQAGQTIFNFKDEEKVDALHFKLNNYKYQNSLKLISLCVKPLEEIMRKLGKLTYFDYLYNLRNMLVNDAKNEGKLIKYIFDHHSYFLIDEFQDTNPLQAEIFFYLTAVDSNKQSWKLCIPSPGSLFIVGDPKQSIYRFRSADVSSYLNIKELFIKNNIGKVKYLVNNFRSKNVVKQYFNDVFNDVMSEESKDQSKYCDIENIYGEEVEEFNGIFTYESYSESLLGDFPQMSDNNQLVRIIKTLVNNPSYKIVGKDKKLRTITYSDFMIIFSAKKNIASCIEKFEEENIPIRVEGKVLFEECEGLKLISNIYETLTTSSQISLVSTLYSPVFGLNENDLTEYRKAKNYILIQDKEYGSSNIEKALSRLNEERKQINNLTPSSLYEKIIDDFEIFKYVSSEELEIVYYTLELIRGEEHSCNITTYDDAIRYINNLLSGDSGIERCLSLTQNKDAVHIANLHKVKGLEAPIVILAKAGVNSNIKPNFRIEYSDNTTNGYIISINDKNSDSDISYSIIETNDLKEKSEEEKESLLKENDRLVYVAATRARNVLIINDPKQKGRNGNPQSSRSKWKDLKDKVNLKLFEVVLENKNYKEPQHDKVKAEDLYKNNKTTTITNNSTYQYLLPSDIKNSSKYIEDDFVPETNKENTSSTLMGTMVHKLLELIIMSKDSINKENAVNSVINEFVDKTNEEEKEVYYKKLSSIYEVMHNGGYPQKGKVYQDILPILLNCQEVYSEVPFTYKDNQTLCRGYIDLIYRSNNKLHILDWKTNKNDSNLDEHYKDQLSAYIKATETILNEQVEDAFIYHIDINS